MTTAIPTTPQERIQLLDIIRGFALLGILLMNIEYFQRPLAAMVYGLDLDQGPIDFATAWGVFTFVQGKFYTMFSLLFGIGFVIFLDRAMQKSTRPKLLFFRRLLVLAVIGALHLSFVWSGDILLSYALVGLLLLFFSKASVRKLRNWGISLLVIPVLLIWLSAFGIQAAANSPDGAEMIAELAEQTQVVDDLIARGHTVYAEGSFAEVTRYRLEEAGLLYAGGGLIFFIPLILGTMLLGAAFARANVFTQPENHRALFKKMLTYGLIIGLPSALFVGFYGTNLNLMIPDYRGAQVYTLQTVANISLCFAYIAALSLLFLHGKQCLQRLAPAGRMALTNYLLHSIVFTLLFYGYGVGLYGEFGRFATTLMAIALYLGQLWFSGWWLARFQYGPAEWVWRSATYLKTQPMRL